MKTDGEPAMLAIQTAMATPRTARTIPRNPLAYNIQLNGAAAKAVQDSEAHMCVLLLALEARLKITVDVALPIFFFFYPPPFFAAHTLSPGGR